MFLESDITGIEYFLLAFEYCLLKGIRLFLLKQYVLVEIKVSEFSL